MPFCSESGSITLTDCYHNLFASYRCGSGSDSSVFMCSYPYITWNTKGFWINFLKRFSQHGFLAPNSMTRMQTKVFDMENRAHLQMKKKLWFVWNFRKCWTFQASIYYLRILKITVSKGPSGTIWLNPLFYYLHFFWQISLRDLQ